MILTKTMTNLNSDGNGFVTKYSSSDKKGNEILDSDMYLLNIMIDLLG